MRIWITKTARSCLSQVRNIGFRKCLPFTETKRGHDFDLSKDDIFHEDHQRLFGKQRRGFGEDQLYFVQNCIFSKTTLHIILELPHGYCSLFPIDNHISDGRCYPVVVGPISHFLFFY